MKLWNSSWLRQSVLGMGVFALSLGVAQAQNTPPAVPATTTSTMAPASVAAPAPTPAPRPVYSAPAPVVQPVYSAPVANPAPRPAYSVPAPTPAPQPVYTSPATIPVPAPVQAPAASSSAAVSLVDGYVLGPGDVISIAVLGRDEYKPQVQVQVDGSIQLPFLNTIVAANRTVLQLRDDIRRGLMNGGFYADPAVSVTVTTFASRNVVVLGEVGTPGLVSVDRAYRVSEIMARVGGIRASGSDVVTLRRASGEEIKLDINRISTGGVADDPIVNPGDKIFVPKAESFYIYGQVAAAGTYPIASNMTVQMALARAGGMTALGSEKKIKLFRNGIQVGRLKMSDIVKSGDVIVIGERFF